MINEKEMYEIIKDEIINDQKNNSFYFLENFNFCDLNINIILLYAKKPDDEYYEMNCRTINYSDPCYNKLLYHTRFHKDNLIDMINFLFSFRKKFAYSKIVDKIVSKDLFETEEKKCIALINFTTEKEVEKCCVCLDYNTVLTMCNHNLCRICYHKIKNEIEDDEDSDYLTYKICPLCRRRI